MAFGSAAVAEETKSVWSNTPDYDEVRESFVAVGALKAKVEVLELEISEVERSVKRGSRKADDTDAAKEASKDLRRQLAETKAKLYEAQALLDWYNFRKDIFRTVGYATR